MANVLHPNLPNELWKNIPGLEETHQVSNMGRIRSIRNSQGGWKQSVLKPSPRSKDTPYLHITLSVDSSVINLPIHVTVAKVFIPNPDNKPIVNHIDGNKLNNVVTNLEWATYSENTLHAYSTGLINTTNVAKAAIGKKKGNGSIYHNVSWDNTKQKWLASLKDKGVKIFQKRFDDEEEAALYVNSKLDELGYDNRPRNIIKKD